jgi:hypothetical protein
VVEHKSSPYNILLLLPVVKEPIKPIELSRDGSDSSYNRLFDRNLLFISTEHGISEQRGSILSGSQRRAADSMMIVRSRHALFRFASGRYHLTGD